MAAPANKHIGDLNGKWVLNKTLSDPTEPALALQGVGWMTRKAIGLATVTLHAKQHQAPPSPPSTATNPVTHIDIDQTITGGMQGNAERRCLDWEARAHSDWLFGSVRGRTRWATGADVRGWVAETYGAFLAAGDEGGEEWLEEPDGEQTGPEAEFGGPGNTHVLNHVENLDEGRGWTATQVWGFQKIGGERRYVRHVVVADKGAKKVVTMKMVYDYIPE
ncbi:hypothetical protein SLS62_008921 [Diatrype stigma]|uniref:Uncharacterized protein n=1 Tax=Diatrype stigma TaxID=117547 RepID=A0AAN9UJ30_9PEZI